MSTGKDWILAAAGEVADKMTDPPYEHTLVRLPKDAHASVGLIVMHAIMHHSPFLPDTAYTVRTYRRSCAASCEVSGEEMNRENLQNALITVIQSWNRCDACGGENDDAHDSLPHMFEPPDVVEVFLKELKETGLIVTSAKSQDDLVARLRTFAAGYAEDAAQDIEDKREMYSLMIEAANALAMD